MDIKVGQQYTKGGQIDTITKIDSNYVYYSWTWKNNTGKSFQRISFYQNLIDRRNWKLIKKQLWI